MDSPVNEIKQRLSIVDVVREYLPHLKPSGTNWKGLCPFHTEKTPSFMVSQDKEIWHCFGCNEGGDVFTFVMKINGIEFPDALRMLADKAGVTLRRADPQLATLRNKLLDMHIIAGEFYKQELQSERGAHARSYLKERGFGDAQAAEMGLGLSPDLWDKLYSTLQQKGFSAREILASGLVVKNEKGRSYDRFRNRLMFPLRNLQGQIIGFAGRTLTNEDAKYINSPQTMLYNKSDFLYGLDKAKSHIREKGAVIIVEGYFDWMSVWSAGSPNAVAVSGTALTRDHLLVLKRYTGTIVFAFDADSAGELAARKAILRALETGFTVYTINFGTHGFKDPDELIRKDALLWEKLMKERALALENLLTSVFREVKPGDIVAKKQALREYLPFLKGASGIDREHFTEKLSSISGISRMLIEEEMKKIRGEESSIEGVGKEPQQLEQSVGWCWISLLVANPSAFIMIRDSIADDCIKDADVASVFRALSHFITTKGEEAFSVSAFREMHPHGNLLDIWLLKIDELYRDFTEDELAREAKLLTARVKEEFLRDALTEVTREVVEAERERNEEKLATLLRRHTAITGELAELIK